MTYNENADFEDFEDFEDFGPAELEAFAADAATDAAVEFAGMAHSYDVDTGDDY